MSVKLLTALVVALSTLVLEAKATSMDKVNLIGFNQCSCEYITHTVDELAFSPPNCSELIRQRNDGESNQTHIDFRIGLRTLSDYLVDVRANLMNRVQREDQSFATCYPAPVDTTGLHDPSATSQFVGWYGVLITYANYTSALLQDEDMPQEVLKKLDITFQMLVSTLELFSEVIEPLYCISTFSMPEFHYNSTHWCMSEFGSLKHAANMVVHLQSAVANIQDGRKEWTNALGINTYLNNEIAKLHRETWIERYIISC